MVMKPLYFFISLCIAFPCVTLFGHHAVRTTLPRQILAKYAPDSMPHIVFLGSSLTDAALDQVLLDSLFQSGHPPVQAFNCALAEMSGDAYFYLIMKNRILVRARTRPAAVAIELRRFPFTDSKKDFTLLGRGIAADLTLSELMDYSDFLRVSGRFPGVLQSIAFFLHKHWFLYHHRLNVQARILERLQLTERNIPGPRKNPYGLRGDAAETMGRWAREDLNRQAAHGESGPIGRDGYFEDIVDLAQKNNVRLVFFRPPFPPADTVLRGNPVYEKTMALFQKLCDSLGIDNWDLAPAPPGAAWSYSDGIHLDRRSRRIFTGEMAERLRPFVFMLSSRNSPGTR
jgi:hypothetical protein